MSTIDDHTPLSNMSVPGTHDAASINNWRPYVTTQTMSIPQQLDSGVRFLDLRCKEQNGTLWMYHGPVYLGMTLIQVLEMLENFLTVNTDEAIIALVKDEASPSSPAFASAFKAILDNNNKFADLVALGSATPKLGDIRGKIQLVRRSSSPSWAVGIDVSSGWQDNSTSFDIKTPSGVNLTIQDEYAPDAGSQSAVVDLKCAVSQALLTQAKGDPDPDHWYFNFTSATYEPWATPKQLALGNNTSPGVNSKFDTWLSGQTPVARWGVVIFDCPELPQDMILRLILSNTFSNPVQFNKPANFGPLVPNTVPLSVQKPCSTCGNTNNDKYVYALEHFVESMDRCLPAVERYLKHCASISSTACQCKVCTGATL